MGLGSDWNALIGIYEQEAPDGGPSAVANSEKVDALLSEEAKKALYNGIELVKDAKGIEIDIKDARIAFLDYLKTNFSSFDIASTRNQNTIKMEDFLGEEGLKLYKAAIEEERNSKAFRNAVFLKSTTHYEGEKWDKRMVLWVGGPSASGKSYAAEAVVKKMAEEVMPSSGEPGGNDVVSIDGGIEREVSQMRQMVLQAALANGFKGIENLHSHTKLGTKKPIQKAALISDNLSMVIPATFTRGLQSEKMSKFESMNVVHAFCEVKAESGYEDRFQQSVNFSGDSRAWNTRDFRTTDIKMNNLNIGCESKKYEPKYFQIGKIASELARKFFELNSKSKITLTITNDLVFLKKDPTGNWVECKKNDVPEIKMSSRDFSTWQKYASPSGAQMYILGELTEKQESALKDLNTHPRKGLEEWHKICKENKFLSPPLISLKGKSLKQNNKSGATEGLKRGSSFMDKIQKQGKNLVKKLPLSQHLSTPQHDSASEKKTHHSTPQQAPSSTSEKRDRRVTFATLYNHVQNNHQSTSLNPLYKERARSGTTLDDPAPHNEPSKGRRATRG